MKGLHRLRAGALLLAAVQAIILLVLAEAWRHGAIGGPLLLVACMVAVLTSAVVMLDVAKAGDDDA